MVVTGAMPEISYRVVSAEKEGRFTEISERVRCVQVVNAQEIQEANEKKEKKNEKSIVKDGELSRRPNMGTFGFPET